jgi:hypothetical protein
MSEKVEQCKVLESHGLDQTYHVSAAFAFEFCSVLLTTMTCKLVLSLTHLHRLANKHDLLGSISIDDIR